MTPRVWARRSLWAAALAVSYATFAALASGGNGPAWIAGGLAAAALVLGFRRLEPPDLGDDPIPGSARSAGRAVLAGALVAGVSAAAASPAVRDTGLAAGAALATIGALVSAQRLPSEGGLLAAPHQHLRREVSGMVALVIAHAAALGVRSAVHLDAARSLPPVVRDASSGAAALFGGALVVAACARALVDRRLELGVADRAGAALRVGAIALLAALGSAAAGVARPEVALPLGAIVASGAAALAALTTEATRVASAGRILAALLAAAVPPALLAGWLARLEPRTAPVVVLLGTLAAAAGGLAAPALGRLLSPERTRRERAIESASDAALHPDPGQAIERALLALRDRGGPRLATAAIYRVAPAEVLRVDRAGNVITEPAEVPPTLVALAEGEPLGIARHEVLRAAEVRRPDVRPLAAWLGDRHIGAVVLVRDEGGAAALLAIPPAPGRAVLSLDEARALRRLADRLGAAAAAGAALARSLAREAEAHRAAELRSAETRTLRASLDRDARHHEATAAILARPARVAAYGPASRAAIERLERLGETATVLTLLTPPGIDATSWAAVWHLASPRRTAALLLVDGVSVAREPLAFWRDPATSPIDAAGQGTLVVLDPQALPLDVQSYLGASLDRVALAVAVPTSVSALVGQGRLHERLADPLGDRAVAIPPLAARPEDLRALVQEQLVRAGVRLGGAPLGLDPAALAELLEHAWPGNDAELTATLTRATLVARGATLTRADLEAAGFRPQAPRAAAPRGGRRRQEPRG